MNIRTKYLLPLILIIAAMAQGCVVTSLHSLYTPKDVVFDKAFLGEWKADDEIWLFKEGKDKSYHLIIFDKDTSAEFEVRLVRLGLYTFMDMVPRERDLEGKGDGSIISMLHYVPSHSFAKITLGENSFNFDWAISEKWFADYIKKNAKPEVRYEKYDDSYLLTDETNALKRFVLKHAVEKDFFYDTLKLKRVK
jgi:hypothetical protein